MPYRTILKFVVLLTVACASAPSPAPGKLEGPGCPGRILNVPPEWITVIDDTGRYQLRMPPTMRAISEKQAYIHGGQAWEDDQLRVSISYGYWAEYSFDDMAGTRCRVEIDTTSVFLVIGSDRVLGWYDNQSSSHEPVISVSSKTPDDVERLVALALSLRTVPVQ